MAKVVSENPAGATNFSKIKVGATFKAGGETFKKTSDLTFDDVNGIEQYIDPLFDRKIGADAVPPVKVDTSAKIVKEPGIEIETSTPKKAKKSKKSK
jgi:hypothetical protein